MTKSITTKRAYLKRWRRTMYFSTRNRTERIDACFTFEGLQKTWRKKDRKSKYILATRVPIVEAYAKFDLAWWKNFGGLRPWNIFHIDVEDDYKNSNFDGDIHKGLGDMSPWSSAENPKWNQSWEFQKTGLTRSSTKSRGCV